MLPFLGLAAADTGVPAPSNWSVWRSGNGVTWSRVEQQEE